MLDPSFSMDPSIAETPVEADDELSFTVSESEELHASNPNEPKTAIPSKMFFIVLY